MELSEKIFSLRKKLNISQEQLAEKMGVSRQAVSKWESGQSTPDVEKVAQLSTLFQVSTDYLLKNEIEIDIINQLKQSSILDCEKSDGNKRTLIFAFIVICIGMVGTIVFGIIIYKNPVNANQYSSMVQINGYGAFAILCIIMMIAGIILIKRNK